MEYRHDLIGHYLELFRSGSTGILRVECPEGERQIMIAGGVPVFAVSRVTEDKLPMILMRMELISADQYKELEPSLDPSKSIGKNLVDMGVITQEQLVQAAKEQVFFTFMRTLDVFDSKGEFVEQEHVDGVRLPLVFPGDFIRAVLGIKDKEKISAHFNETLGHVFRWTDEEILHEEDLSFDQRLWPFSKLFDGETELSQLMVETHQLDEFTVLKFVYALWTWGFIEEIPLQEQAGDIQRELEESMPAGIMPETVEVARAAETQELKYAEVADPQSEVIMPDFEEVHEEELPHESDLHEVIHEEPHQDIEEEETVQYNLPDQNEDGMELESAPIIDADDENDDLPFYRRKIFLFNLAAAVMIIAAIIVWGRKQTYPEPEPANQSEPAESERDKTDHKPDGQQAFDVEMKELENAPEDELTESEDGGKLSGDLQDSSGQETAPPMDTTQEKYGESESGSGVPKQEEEDVGIPVPSETDEPVEQLQQTTETENQNDPRRFRSPVIDGEVEEPVGRSGDLDEPPLNGTATVAAKRNNHTEPGTEERPEPLADLPSGEGNGKKDHAEVGKADSALKQADPDLSVVSTEPEATPGELMQSGDFEQAARVWAGRKKVDGEYYTLALELACQGETLLNDYRASQGANSFFILPKQHQGKTCFWVCWGTYKRKEQADRAIISLPDDLKYGSNPKTVLISSLY